MKPHVRFLLSFALAVLAVVGALEVIPRPLDRQLATLEGDARRLSALVYRMQTDPRPIDVAFIGSSHTVLGIDDAGIERAMHARGFNVQVANLGMFFMARDLQYWLERKLLASKQPALIVIQIDEHTGPYSHEYMPYVGNARDMLVGGVPLNFPRMLALSLKEQFLGLVDAVAPGRGPLTPQQHWAYGWAPAQGVWSGQRTTTSLGEKLQARFGPSTRRAIFRATDYYEKGAITRMTALAKAHKAHVVFLYLPEYQFAAHPDPETIAWYARLAPVIVVPKSIGDDRVNWLDESHLNRNGAEKLSAALGVQIQRLLR
jgi:hypothetical protein